MPKVIDNVREKIIEETKKIVMEQGYSAVSVRAVSKNCRIASGTIYNYFPSKESMIAACMHEDWKVTVEGFEKAAAENRGIKALLKDIFDGIVLFCSEHARVIGDPEARASFGNSFNRYHMTLVMQVSGIIDGECEKAALNYNKDLAPFVAENLIVRAARGDGFEPFYGIVGQLFKD